MERMHWTYQELMAQPKPILDALGVMVSAEAEHQQIEKDLQEQRNG